MDDALRRTVSDRHVQRQLQLSAPSAQRLVRRHFKQCKDGVVGKRQFERNV